MIYLYDTSEHTYINVTDYLTSIESDAGNVYRLIFLFNLDTLFDSVKKRTAWRGRFARNNKGLPLLDELVITDDERDMFDDLIKSGSAEAYRYLSAWAKNIAGAYRHNVKFGDPVESGTVTSGGATNVLTDSNLALVTNALTGCKLVITSPGLAMNQERTIQSNTANTITLDSTFDVDVTGMEYAVMTQTDDFIIYYLDMDLEWDINMLLAASTAIEQALIAFFVKEWYIINRYMDDAQIEATRYGTELANIRKYLTNRKTPARRSGEIFS